MFFKNCRNCSTQKMKSPLWISSANASMPGNIYLFQVNNRNTRKWCEICSKLIIKTPEQRHWRRSDLFTVNFELFPHLFLVFLLLIFNRQILAGNGHIYWRFIFLQCCCLESHIVECWSLQMNNETTFNKTFSENSLAAFFKENCQEFSTVIF